MANVNTKAHVLIRDGFICRYCGRRLYLSPAVKVLDMHIPGLNLWDLHGKREPLRSCWATVDHIIPESKGGMDVLQNLVACCVVCNSSKGESDSTDKLRPTYSSSWDGLCCVFIDLMPSYIGELGKEDKKWYNALLHEKVKSDTEQVQKVLIAFQQLLREPQQDYANKLEVLMKQAYA